MYEEGPLYGSLFAILTEIENDPVASSDLASDLLDRKGEELFISAVYHKARRLGIPVERERLRCDLAIGGEVIEVKMFSPWTVMRDSDGRRDRSFDDFIHSKDLNALKAGHAQWLAAVIVHPLDRPHRQYPKRSHPGIIDADDLVGEMSLRAQHWGYRNGVHLRHRFPLEIADTVEGSDNGRVAVLVLLFRVFDPETDGAVIPVC